MAVHHVPQIVLDEARDVLDDLVAWLRHAPACPVCEAQAGCSHLPRCPLGRVVRLRRLLDGGDQQRRDEEVAALGRERAAVAGAPVTDVVGADTAPFEQAALRWSETEAAPVAGADLDDLRARALVVEALQLTATRCFAEAAALRARGGKIRTAAAAEAQRAGRYAEAAAAWLVRNGTRSLGGQGALLGGFARESAAVEASR
jgi:hypothetical protein